MLPRTVPAAYVEADLTVSIEREDLPPVNARVTGKGSRLDLEVDDPGAFAGGEDAPALRGVAEALAGLGVTMRVTHRGRHLVSLGAVRAPWWQRRFTGTRRIKVGSWRGAFTSATARARATESILPGPGLAPPSTLFPPFPTLQLRARRTVSTTHDPAMGGGPRLVEAYDFSWGNERPPVHWLAAEFTIGSSPECDLVLSGLAPHHASVRHRTEDDEYVVVAADGVTRVHGAPVDQQVLRTGARLEVGSHTLVYYREEFADHGRPYGGRIGGELGRQLPQPPRDELLREPV